MTVANIRALVAKDTHHLFPLVIAFLALEVLGLLDSFLTRSPDSMTWSELSILLNPELADLTGVLYVIFGMVAAYMMFPHEGKQQTLQFLWSLPVRRWHIYSVKLATALLVLTGVILIGHLALLWVGSFSVGSMTSSQFSWSLWWRELAVLCGVTAIALGYGALVASFRVIGILAFLAFWTAIAVLGNFDTSFEYLNVTALLVLEFRGSEILLNPKTWAVQSAIALVCVFAAGYRWTRDGQAPAERTRMHRIGARIATGLSVVAVLLLIVGYGTMRLAPDLLSLDTEYESLELESYQTQYYEISFYGEDREQAWLFLDEADQYAEQVQQLIDFTTSELILADLTHSSADHLGIAGWNKLRMERSALYDEDLRSHVFVHETAHVLAAAASDRRLRDNHAHALFFTEGLAEWASFQILGLDEQRDALRLLSALAWKRLNLRFEDMLYAGNFRSQFDEALIYALGEAWVSTLADVCGEQAPGAALAAMARPGAPRRARGNEFWRDTLQASGCDLGAVNSEFSLLMRSYENQIDAVPELNAAISTKDDQLIVRLSLSSLETEQPYDVFVRVRDSAAATSLSVVTESATLQPGESVSLRLPLRMISGQRFQYQLGIEFLPGERPFFGRWIDEG